MSEDGRPGLGEEGPGAGGLPVVEVFWLAMDWVGVVRGSVAVVAPGETGVRRLQVQGTGGAAGAATAAGAGAA